MAIPNVFTVRMHAMRVLKEKFPQIIDALEHGGSGDMYAGLNAEEQEALREVTRMGFPPQSWFGYKTMGVHGFSAVYPGVVMADAAYFDHDFWNVPGYLGAHPPASLLAARIQKTSKIKRGIAEDEAVKMGLMAPLSGRDRGTADAAWKSLGQREGTMPVAFQLEDVLPDIDFLGGDLFIKTGAARGKTLPLTQISGDKVLLGATDPNVLAEMKPGDEVEVDNSNFLAAQTYHRHQVSGKEYSVWDQFRDADGQPMYPQRPLLLGPLFTQAASGVLPSGKFKGKMIVVEALWDREAFLWQADWYRSRVEEHLGESTDDHFRLWYVDHALHGDFTEQEDPTRTISYLGVLQQALRDLSAWVEKGRTPPATTSYTIEDGQVIIPATAAERKGIQPVVTVKANGGERAEVQVGKPVTFTAEIEVPPHTGTVVAAEWDFEGAGTFPVAGKFSPVDKTASRVTLSTTYTFSKPGTYFPTLRAVSQRQGDAQTPYARIQNLGRVRVAVT
jgi:plastocyanin